jgi:hypothetical protein
MKKLPTAAVALIALSSSALAQVNTNQLYNGNGNSGFGGVIGTGTLNISNNDTGNLAFTLNKGAGSFNDAIVLYIDSVAGGFGDTLSFNDQADPSARAFLALPEEQPEQMPIHAPL